MTSQILVTTDVTNNTNYTGSLNTNVFQIQTNISSFTNNATVLGGGGSGRGLANSSNKIGNHGKDAILINANITVTNIVNNIQIRI